MIGLLLFGVILGPRGLEFFDAQRPIADFFAQLGKLLLMFSAGLEIDVQQFRKTQIKAIGFGVATTIVPPLLGKWLAAEGVGRPLRYDKPMQQTMWALTLPQAAATIAATPVAYDTRNAARGSGCGIP